MHVVLCSQLALLVLESDKDRDRHLDLVEPRLLFITLELIDNLAVYLMQLVPLFVLDVSAPLLEAIDNSSVVISEVD